MQKKGRLLLDGMNYGHAHEEPGIPNKCCVPGNNLPDFVTAQCPMGTALLQSASPAASRTGLKHVTHTSGVSEVTHQMIRSGVRCDAVSRRHERFERGTDCDGGMGNIL